MPEGGAAAPRSVAARFVLGTVQLGLPYGRLRRGALMPAALAEAILDRAWAVGVRWFDTAEDYGEAPTRLAAWLTRRSLDEAAVITKVTPTGDRLPDRANRALDRFAGARRRVLLSHGAADLAVWDMLRSVTAELGVEAGQSVYTAAEVRAAATTSGVSRIQAPGNVFDLGALEARGASSVALDLRSVFLQGVLLERPDVAEARVPGAGALAEAVASAAADVGLAAGPLLVAAILDRCRSDDRLVIGADAPEQLDVIPAALALQGDVVRGFRERVTQAAPPAGASVMDPRAWS